MEIGTNSATTGSHRTLDSDSDHSKLTESTPIVLPVGNRLSYWRVTAGSVVRIGETVAAISPIDPTTGTDTADCHNSSDSLNSNQLLSTNHKRPSRRKRPLPVTTSEVLPGSPTEDSSATKPESSDTTVVPSKVLDSVIRSTETNKPSNANAIHQLRDVGGTTTIAAQADGICRKIDTATSIASKTDVIIGWIDPCRHPTVIAGLCAVCGTKVANEVPVLEDGSSSSTSLTLSTGTETTTSNHLNQNNTGMTLMTVSGMTVTVSESESKRMAMEDTKRLEGIKKLSLVLDLDHTLLHATADPRAALQCRHRTDVRRLVLPFMMMTTTTMMDGTINFAMYPQQQPQYHHPGWLQQHFVKLRPHVQEFLEHAMENYELGVYTAGTRDYAEQVTILLSRHLLGVKRDQIELEQLRQECFQTEQTYHRQQMARKSKDSAMEPTNETFGKVDLDLSNENDEEVQQKSNDSKRKRVQFEPAPVATKTDEISLEMLETLRADLSEAEHLERQAHDLRRKLFGSRVMSRTESGESGRHVKSLKRIFPCGGSMAAVIDDREDVWANAEEISASRLGEPPENLLLVRPYHWSLFHGYADVNNASGMDFSQVDASSQVETDEQLLWTSKILKTLHQRYYNDGDSPQHTVPMILEEMRSEVLQDCIIVLSGLIPLSKQQSIDQTQPRPSFLRYAESLGAIVRSNVSDDVTHVVAASDGTDKILAARKIKGCYVVKPSWLVECYWSMTRRDESVHLIGTTLKRTLNDPTFVPTSSDQRRLYVANSTQLAATPSQDNVDNNDDDDDDDDDFAAELENEFLNEVNDL